MWYFKELHSDRLSCRIFYTCKKLYCVYPWFFNLKEDKFDKQFWAFKTVPLFYKFLPIGMSQVNGLVVSRNLSLILFGKIWLYLNLVEETF